MRIDLITLFPDACQGYLDASIVGRTRRRGLIEVNLVDPRAWAGGRHRKVDDRPFGGGPGMVMMAPPLAGCLDHLLAQSDRARVLITSPQGQTAGPAARRRTEQGRAPDHSLRSLRGHRRAHHGDLQTRAVLDR